MKMIFLFIDGFGVGNPDIHTNPFYKAHIPFLLQQLSSQSLITVDASMDIPGLPQSATGQTALFTGVNAAKVLGRHLSGQPTETLKDIIYRESLFSKLKELNFTVTNSNVYRDEYLEQMQNPSDRRLRPSVTSVMCMAAGVPFRTVGDYIAGNGLYHDITGQRLYNNCKNVQVRSPEEAASVLYNISRGVDFTLFEHFMTDIIGHKGDMEMKIKHLEMLDRFINKLVDTIDPNEDIIIITSDHGNIEDASTKTHTKNKIPVILVGEIHEEPIKNIKSITDIMPALLEIAVERGVHK